jgi:hypothetical protein
LFILVLKVKEKRRVGFVVHNFKRDEERARVSARPASAHILEE